MLLHLHVLLSTGLFEESEVSTEDDVTWLKECCEAVSRDLTENPGTRSSFTLLEVAAASFIRTPGAALSFSIQRGRQQGAPTARAARSQSCSHPCSPRSQQQVPGGAGGFAFASFSGDSDFGSSRGLLEGSRGLFRCCCAFLFTSPLLLGSALLLLRSRKHRGCAAGSLCRAPAAHPPAQRCCLYLLAGQTMELWGQGELRAGAWSCCTCTASAASRRCHRRGSVQAGEQAPSGTQRVLGWLLGSECVGFGGFLGNVREGIWLFLEVLSQPEPCGCGTGCQQRSQPCGT
ncbi:hypothetical protein Anapl_11504 [Anas platyrhynchos]|uniref:Uncharacterized protein n=1 Tax=Anas platyrhynchos TaxID=8839 RepID=R0L8M5_ANAPL|nr:hypothetical protein Anapl_11504 [Anas platyrhynchos]